MENVESMDNQKETAAVPFLPIGSVVLLKRELWYMEER